MRKVLPSRPIVIILIVLTDLTINPEVLKNRCLLECVFLRFSSLLSNAEGLLKMRIGSRARSLLCFNSGKGFGDSPSQV